MTDRDMNVKKCPRWPAGLRGAVQSFAERMESNLHAHDDRPGWQDEPVKYLWARLLEELEELDDAINYKTPDDIIGECADAANFLMMIADNVSREAP